MKDNLMQMLGAVLNALNEISVNGKANLANLAGSIATLEDVATKLNKCTIQEEGSDK
ncbi:hypothetical protein AALD01_02625 [Oscillospiraceae bacterium 21-37]